MVKTHKSYQKGSLEEQKTVGEVGERQLLKYLRQCLQVPLGVGEIGVGDDAALLVADRDGVTTEDEVGHKQRGNRAQLGWVSCCDMLVEGVDFRFDWSSWHDIGAKAAAVNLSDIAAMGATPKGLLLSLALRNGDRVEGFKQLVDGVSECGLRFGAPLIGGDLSAIDGPLVLSITAMGIIDPALAMKRHQACAGDLIVVSGELGGASVGLQLLEQGLKQGSGESSLAVQGLDKFNILKKRQLTPLPQVDLGQALAQSGLIHSCVDLSDGLASDIWHLLPDGMGAVLELESLPHNPLLAVACGELKLNMWEMIQDGGEDFELLFALPSDHFNRVQRIATELNTALTVIGTVHESTQKSRVTVGDASGNISAILGKGFSHFG